MGADLLLANISFGTTVLSLFLRNLFLADVLLDISIIECLSVMWLIIVYDCLVGI